MHCTIMVLNYIIWDAHPILLRLGLLEIRWYGLLFASGFLMSYYLWYQFLQKEHKPIEDLEELTIHIMMGTMIGARLGHVLFYDWAYFAKHPLEIFLPFTFTPTIRFTGYAGLASHGAAIGILIAMYLYSNYVIRMNGPWPKLVIKKQRRVGQSMLWVADRMMIVVALTGCLIRIGNFMNSEIFGKPTHCSYGVIFARNSIERCKQLSSAVDAVHIIKHPTSTAPNEQAHQPVQLLIHFKHGQFEETRVRYFLEKNIHLLLTTSPYSTKHLYTPPDTPLQYVLKKDRKGAYLAAVTAFGIPRHPAQLYEAFSCLLIGLLLLRQWQLKKSALRPGTLFGFSLIGIFGLRMVYECWKESKVAHTTILGSLKTPQLLSLPLLIAGVVVLLHCMRYKKQHDRQ